MGNAFKLKNGTLLLITEAPGGIYNSAQLNKIAALADQDSAIIKVTEDQRLALFVKEDEAAGVASQLKEIGLGIRHYQDGLHQPTTCIGELCPDHQQDSLGTAMSLTEEIESLSIENPIKIGINGCAKCCVPCHTLDISIIGDENGYRVNLGGKGSQIPEMATFMADGVPSTELPRLIRSVIEIYKEAAEVDESLQDVMDRIGISKFTEALKPYSQDAAHTDDLLGGLESTSDFEVESEVRNTDDLDQLEQPAAVSESESESESVDHEDSFDSDVSEFEDAGELEETFEEGSNELDGSSDLDEADLDGIEEESIDNQDFSTEEDLNSLESDEDFDDGAELPLEEEKIEDFEETVNLDSELEGDVIEEEMMEESDLDNENNDDFTDEGPKIVEDAISEEGDSLLDEDAELENLDDDVEESDLDTDFDLSEEETLDSADDDLIYNNEIGSEQSAEDLEFEKDIDELDSSDLKNDFNLDEDHSQVVISDEDDLDSEVSIEDDLVGAEEETEEMGEFVDELDDESTGGTISEADTEEMAQEKERILDEVNNSSELLSTDENEEIRDQVATDLESHDGDLVDDFEDDPQSNEAKKEAISEVSDELRFAGFRVSPSGVLTISFTSGLTLDVKPDQLSDAQRVFKIGDKDIAITSDGDKISLVLEDGISVSLPKKAA